MMRETTLPDSTAVAAEPSQPLRLLVISMRYLQGRIRGRRAAILGYYADLDADALAARLTAESAGLRGRALDGFWRGAREIRPENLAGNVRARASAADEPAAGDKPARHQRTYMKLAQSNVRVWRIVYPLLSGLFAVGLVLASLATPWRWEHSVLYVLVAAFVAANVWWIPPRLERAEVAYYEVLSTPRREGLGAVARTRARWALASVVCVVGGLVVIAGTAALLY